MRPGRLDGLPLPPGRVWVALAFGAALPCWVAFAQVPPPSRLTGIVIGPKDRVAIFAGVAEHDGPTVLGEGDRVGPWQIQAINPDSVLVTGSDGPRLLAVEGAARGGDARSADGSAGSPPVLAAAQQTGMTVGRLASQHDACVRRGLSVPSTRGGEAQFRAMLDAMSRVPARTGDDAARDAPAKEMATAMLSGWEAAKRADAGVSLDTERCREIGELWTRAAAAYGFE